MYEITIGELRAAVPRISEANARLWAGPLSKACEAFKINTPRRIVHFLAQLGHESWDFARLEENLNYSESRLRQVCQQAGSGSRWRSLLPRVKELAGQPYKLAEAAYGGRMGNRAEGSGDGWRHRGSGPMQHTGRDGFEKVTDWLAPFGAPNFVEQPDLLRTPQWGAMAAAAFWIHNNLNYWADKDDGLAVGRAINLGNAMSSKTPNGQPDRASRLATAKKALANYERSSAK